MFSEVSEACARFSQPLALHLVEEINHRVINEYAEAVAMLSMATSRQQTEAVPVLAAAADRLRAHAESHRALLAPASKAQMDLGEYVARYCACLSRASLQGRGIRLKLSADEILIEGERGWRVGLIVSELIRNAVRHGLHGRQGEIEVDLRRLHTWVQCVVSDNGCAINASPEGRGRRLVNALATELEGSAHWRLTNTGSVVSVAFPIEATAI
jgi:two-component sensor histidine kinase